MFKTNFISQLLITELQSNPSGALMYLLYYLIFLQTYFFSKIHDSLEFEKFKAFLKVFINITVRYCNLNQKTSQQIYQFFLDLYEINKDTILSTDTDLRLAYNQIFNVFQQTIPNIKLENFDGNLTRSEFSGWIGKTSSYLWLWIHTMCSRQDKMENDKNYRKELLYIIFQLDVMIGCSACLSHYNENKNIIIYELLNGTHIDEIMIKFHNFIKNKQDMYQELDGNVIPENTINYFVNHYRDNNSKIFEINNFINNYKSIKHV